MPLFTPHSKRTQAVGLFGLFQLIFLAGHAQAASLTWDNGAGTGKWNATDLNWSGASTWNNATPDTATFGATGVGTVTLTTGIMAGGLTFNTAGYTVAGNTLTLSGTSTVTANADATINSAIAGSTWTKMGTGTLTLSGATTVSTYNARAGTLTIAGTSSTGANYNMGGGGSTSVLNFTGTNSGGSNLFMGSSASDNMTLNFSGSATNMAQVFIGYNAGASATMNMTGGTFTMTNNTQNFIMGNSATTATVNVSGGTLTIARHLQMNQRSANSTFNLSGGVVHVAGVVAMTGWTTGGANATFNLDGGRLETTGVQMMTPGAPGTSGTGTFNFNGGTLQAYAVNASFMTGLTRVNIRDGGAIIDSSNITIGQALLHSNIGGDNAIDGGLTKLGNGTLTLTGVNTYTGTTTVSAGTLLVNGTHAAGTGNYSVGTSGRLGGTGTLTTAGAMTIDGQINGGDFGTVGTLNITGAGSRALSGTYLFDVDYGTNTGDVLNITGATALDINGGTFELGTALGATPAAGSHYAIKIFESNVADATTAPGQSNFTNVSGLASHQSIVTWDGGKTYYLVPEPGSFALLALGSFLLLRRPSRRRRGGMK